MRDDILKLVSAFPGVSVGRVCRFIEGARPYIEALEREGLVRRDSRAVGRGKPVECLWSTGEPDPVVTIPPGLAEENRETRARVTRWAVGLGALADDRASSGAVKRHALAALTMLGALYRAPHRFGREVPLAGLVEICGGDACDRRWMRGARLLEERGVIDLFERKGANRVTTLQLRTPPPLPLA